MKTDHVPGCGRLALAQGGLRAARVQDGVPELPRRWRQVRVAQGPCRELRAPHRRPVVLLNCQSGQRLNSYD